MASSALSVRPPPPSPPTPLSAPSNALRGVRPAPRAMHGDGIMHHDGQIQPHQGTHERSYAFPAKPTCCSGWSALVHIARSLPLAEATVTAHGASGQAAVSPAPSPSLSLPASPSVSKKRLTGFKTAAVAGWQVGPYAPLRLRDHHLGLGPRHGLRACARHVRAVRSLSATYTPMTQGNVYVYASDRSVAAPAGDHQAHRQARTAERGIQS